MIETAGAILGVVLAGLALLGALWRWVILPNLREQLLDPIRENHRQLTENKHRNHPPTFLDRVDDLENHIELVALNQHAVLKRLGQLVEQLDGHTKESEKDRARLWLIVESLIHETREEGKHRDAD